MRPDNELTVDNAAHWVNAIIPDLPDEPAEPKAGRGIVMAAGGARLQINAWVCIRMLRHLGCDLPIQCWYLGTDERNQAWEELVSQHDVECIDAYEVRERHPHQRLHGWELKPYAIAHSPFQEVLFLDADNVPVVDPTYLFDQPEYCSTGSMFWPDFGRLAPDRLAWKVFGDIPYRDELEVESGQVLVDKSRCWRALALCNWYMQNSNNFFFYHVHGDKEVFHLAWRKLDQPYIMPERGIDALDGVMCQHDLTGNRVFQHRNMRKWTLYHNPTTPRFTHEDTCLEFLNELKHQWSPAAGSPASDADRSCIDRLDSKSFVYHRIGHDHRVIQLSRDGTFQKNAAYREQYWTIRDNLLRVVGEDGCLTMELHEERHGIWYGQWLDYERMPIALVPTGAPAA